MNENMKNSIYRLCTMVSLMRKDGTTINKMAEIMDIDKNILYEDIISIKKDTENKIIIDTDDERYEDDFSIAISSEKKKSLKNFTENIRRGLYDDINIYKIGSNAKYEIILSADELEILQDFLCKDLINHYKRGSLYHIKGYYPELNEEYINNLKFIIDSIDEGSSIEIEYDSKKNNIQKVIRPIKIINNTDDGLLYVFDHRGQFYRVDRILFVRPSDIKQTISSKIDINKLNKMWGINYSDEYTHIKLKIFDEGNVLERVRKDLGDKVNSKTFLLNESGGYALYEDDIVGVDSFLTWVYSYGSSMVLLSPERLVKRIVESIKIRKKALQIPD